MNRLYRSRSQRMIAGVAGGMAEYFEVDVVLVRLLWVVFGLMGAGVLAYLLAAIIMPEKKDSVVVEPNVRPGQADHPGEDLVKASGEGPARERRHRNLGLLLVGLGVILLLPQVIPGYIFHNFWPVLLVLLGVFLLIRGGKGE